MLLLGMLAGSALVPALLKAMGAKKAMTATLGAGVVISAVYWLCGYGSLPVVLAFSLLLAVVTGAFSVLVNSMTADSIDYAELTFGTRTEGIITSTRTFVTKLATALAGTAAALALEAIQYVPNTEQTQSVKDSIQGMMSLWPAILYAAGFAVMTVYPLTREKFTEMERTLGEKRSAK
jgi:Na+/melibiose symporter-like transporter